MASLVSMIRCVESDNEYHGEGNNIAIYLKEVGQHITDNHKLDHSTENTIEDLLCSAEFFLIRNENTDENKNKRKGQGIGGDLKIHIMLSPLY